MSLNTLLEAAKYLELQELKEKESQAALDAALANKAPIVTPAPQNNVSPPPIQKPIKNFGQINQQTVVITTSNLTTNMVHSPITITTNNIKKEIEIPPNPRHRVLQNSFDIINPLFIDETNEGKRKQPPLVFRAGTREVHNKLEKHRRAHLKECFDALKKQLPVSPDEKKTSNLSILHSAIRYIQTLKKKEREFEHEMERLAREKISSQTKLALLKKDLSAHYENVDFSKLLPDVVPISQNSSTLSNNGESITVMKHDPDSDCTKIEVITAQQNGAAERIAIPVLTNKSHIPVSTTTMTSLKEVQQPVQTALSVLPVGYPLNQGLVLQKLAIVPKSLTELVPTFIATQQQIHNGKVVPLVNAQYVVKPLVVVSTASPRPS